jgi:site-specific DNA-cytosine methylase
MLTFVELAARKRPRWVVWENVPGVLSSNKGGDFASFLGLLTGRDIQAPVGGWTNSGCIEGISSAYGVAWTMLDAQDFGVAQRRKRIFVIGYLGDWRPPAAVLFERNRLQGDTTKSREKRKATSADAQGGVGGGSQYWGSNPECSDTVTSKWHKGSGGPAGSECGLFVSHPAHAFKVRGGSETETGEQGGTPGKKAGKGYLGQDEKVFTIGTTQDQQIAQPVPYRKTKRAQSKDDHETWVEDDKANTINTFDVGDVRTTQAIVQPTIIDRAAFNQGANAQYDIKITQGETMPSLVAKGPHGVAYKNVLEANPFNDTFAYKGINHGRTQERDSVKTLSILREKIGTKAFAQWGLGVFNTLQSTQILQSDLHGIDVRPATFSDSRFIYGSLSCKENDSAWIMQSLREAGCEGCTSQGWKLSEQYIGELRAYLSELPHEKPQNKRFMHDLWEADERFGLLRQALSKVQNTWESFVGESKSTQTSCAIRRLTPFETEILQGFPRGWTKIPYRNKPADQCPDGPRYKACGNSMAVPVMRWIGQRIQMVDNILNPPKS